MLVTVSQSLLSALCACRSICFILRQAYNSAITFISCLCRGLWLRDDCLGPFRFFLSMPQLWAHVHGLLDSQEYSELFRTLYGYLMPPLFLLSFSVSFLFGPTASEAGMLNDCSWLFLTNSPGEKAVRAGQALRSNKKKPQEWGFSGDCL